MLPTAVSRKEGLFHGKGRANKLNKYVLLQAEDLVQGFSEVGKLAARSESDCLMPGPSFHINNCGRQDDQLCCARQAQGGK
jgi:hypothetical protein